MEIKINVERYITEDEIREMIRENTEYEISSAVYEYFRKHSYSDFIESVAVRAYWEAVDELGEDTMGKIRRQVRKIIPKLSEYSLLGNEFVNGKTVPKRTQQIVNEEAEKLRPEFAAAIRAAFKSALDSEGPEIVGDTVADMLRDALAERGQ